MSRSSKKAGRRMNRQRFSKTDLCDVTLDDFANSSVMSSSGSGRTKKNNMQVSQVVEEVKQLTLDETNQTWEEKLNNLESFDKGGGGGGGGGDDVEESSGNMRKSNSRRRKRTVTSETVDEDSGVDYPIDIWFLISEYILPEDVGKFAAICKTSSAVVSTAKFWFNLYKRYYRSVANLPEQLQPECMVRRYGLRANVIRALHFMYPPFSTKLRPEQFLDGDPHLLTKRLCVIAWSQKIKNHWLFYFKLKQMGSLKRGREVRRRRKPDLLEMLEDITVNVDDKCKVLQVTCLNYIILPMLSGQILSGVSLNVSHGMRHHKLQLNFSSGPFLTSSSSPVILDPVIKIRVLDWWHPSFPRSDTLNTSLLSSRQTARQRFEELEF